MSKEYDEDAYLRIVTIILPAKVDFSSIIDFSQKYDGVGNDCLIHRDVVDSEESWTKIGKGIAGTFCCYYKKLLRGLMDAGSA